MAPVIREKLYTIELNFKASAFTCGSFFVINSSGVLKILIGNIGAFCGGNITY
jgi:hypothetical protein